MCCLFGMKSSCFFLFYFIFAALRTDLGKCFQGNMFSHMQADISDTLVGTRMGGGTEY